MCISLSVFSEVIVDDGGVSFLSQDGYSERCRECTFIGMHFLNRETCSKVKNDKDICLIIDYFHVSEHFLRCY